MDLLHATHICSPGSPGSSGGCPLLAGSCGDFHFPTFSLPVCHPLPQTRQRQILPQPSFLLCKMFNLGEAEIFFSPDTLRGNGGWSIQAVLDELPLQEADLKSLKRLIQSFDLREDRTTALGLKLCPQRGCLESSWVLLGNQLNSEGALLVWRSPDPVGFREPQTSRVFQDHSCCPKWTSIQE